MGVSLFVGQEGNPVTRDSAILISPVRLNIALLLSLVLTGCTPGTSGILDSARFTAANLTSSSNSSPSLQSGTRYLRVSIDGGRVVFLALGYIEGERGEVEVWYSAEGEVLKLSGGRIISTVGLPVDWRRVTFSRLPAWTEIGKMPHTFERERDVMPGYRLNVRETLEIREIFPPAPDPLPGIDPVRVRWFEESTVGPSVESRPLRPTRYALLIDPGSSVTVEPLYGKQCLSADLCFSWQKLPIPPKGPT